MSIKVKELAEKLELEEPAVIEFLSDLGIYAEDIDDTLNDDEERKLNEILAASSADLRSDRLLKFYVKNYKILIDTSSLLKSLSNVMYRGSGRI